MASLLSLQSSAVLSRLSQTQSDLQSTVESLSSGKKSDISADQLAVGTALDSDAAVLRTAIINSTEGRSFLRTAEDAVDSIIDLLQQQQVLATQATSSALTDNQLANLNQQFQVLSTEIDRVVTDTTFNDKVLLDGSQSGNALLTSNTGQAVENYSLLTTSDLSLSGTALSGDLDTSTTNAFFSLVDSDDVGKTFASTTISLTHNGGGALSSDATFEVNGSSISFGNGNTTTAELGTSLVAALEASTDAEVRKFTYRDNSDGTITVTAADSGDAFNSVTFQLTDNNGGSISAATLGTATDIDGSTSTITAATGSTAGTDRTVASADETIDANLQGAFSNFTASLDTTTGPQNLVTFTVDVNDVTYTSQQVALFGTGGFNAQGNTIKGGQVITFENSSGPTDGSSELTDNVFTFTVGSSDVTISGSTEAAFSANVTAVATGFGTQLASLKINQSRDVVLAEQSPTTGDFEVTAAQNTTFDGIESFDADGTNTKGDITFVGDRFGPTGNIGRVGTFDFNSATNIITTTIAGETFTADLSDNTASTGGIVDGAGNYNSTTKLITVGAGTTIVFSSAATDDGRQLRLDLSNLDATSIDISTTTLETTFETDLNTLFGVTSGSSPSFQVGGSSSNTIGISINSLSTDELFLDDQNTPQSLNISTNAGATTALEVVDNALNTALLENAKIGATMSSFSSAIESTTQLAENIEATRDLLLNTDVAEETVRFAELTVRNQAAISLLSQIQTQAESILKVLEAS